MDALEQENEDRIVGDLVRTNLSEVIFTAEHWGMKACSLNFLRVCGRVKRPSSSFVSAKSVKTQIQLVGFCWDYFFYTPSHTAPKTLLL